MKAVKRTALIVCILFTLTLLCGCSFLDELRDTRAVYVDGTDKKEISYKGSTYIYLIDEYELRYKIGDYAYIGSIDMPITISTSDVPLLLSGFYDEEAYISDDRKVITVTDEEREEYENYYIREDVYDALRSELENGIEYVSLGYGYFDYSMANEDSQYVYVTLSQEEEEFLLEFLKTQPSRAVTYEENQFSYQYGAVIWATSESGIIRNDIFEIILTDNGGYRVELFENGYELVFGSPFPDDCDLIVYDSTVESDELFAKIIANIKKYQ